MAHHAHRLGTDRWFEIPIRQNLLRYIDELDVDAVKAEVAKQGPWR